MKKYIALLLCLVLTLSLCACGPKENLVGTWKTSVNMAEMLNTAMAEAGMGDYIQVETFELPIIMELREDGTATLSVDAEGMAATADKLVEDMIPGLEKFLVDSVAAAGVELSLEEILAASGIASMEEFAGQLKDDFLNAGAFDEVAAELKYKAKDGKLYFSDDLESDVVLGEYNTYKLEGDTLTLDVGNMEIDEEDEELAKYMFPMVLTRVK